MGIKWFINFINKIKKNEPYYSCHPLQNGGISFNTDDNIHVCCVSRSEECIIAKTSDSIEKILKEISRKKLKLIENFKKGERHGACKNCFMLKKGNWSEPDLGVSFVNMNHFITCNLKCKYCEGNNANLSEMLKNSDTKAVLKVLRGLINKGIIGRNAVPIEIAGGEPSIVKDIDSVIDFCVEVGCFTRVHTNGTVFKDCFTKVANTENIFITLTPDAGSRDVYLKIKGVDCFDKVWENIGKYMEATNSCKNFETKFIIQPDNFDDVENMIKMCLKHKVKATIVDLDFTKEDIDICIPAVTKFIELCQENKIDVKRGLFLPEDIWDDINNKQMAKI